MSDRDLDLSSSTRDAVAVVHATGELDYGTAPKLRLHLFATADEHAGAVVADLTGVSFIDSTGLGLLLHMRQRMRDSGRGFAICVTDALVRRTVAASGLDGMLPVFDSLDEAVAAVA